MFSYRPYSVGNYYFIEIFTVAESVTGDYFSVFIYFASRNIGAFYRNQREIRVFGVAEIIRIVIFVVFYFAAIEYRFRDVGVITIRKGKKPDCRNVVADTDVGQRFAVAESMFAYIGITVAYNDFFKFGTITERIVTDIRYVVGE